MAKKIHGEVLEDVLMRERPDRRLLPHVPGKRRSGHSRRALPDEILEKYSYLKFSSGEMANERYLVDYPVRISSGGRTFQGVAQDISVTGMGLMVTPEEARNLISAGKAKLSFEITPGTMPEGMEMKVKVDAHVVRPSAEQLEADLARQQAEGKDTDKVLVGLSFDQNLLDVSQHNSRFDVPFVSSLLAIIFLCIVLMRTESIIYSVPVQHHRQYLFAGQIHLRGFLPPGEGGSQLYPRGYHHRALLQRGDLDPADHSVCHGPVLPAGQAGSDGGG